MCVVRHLAHRVRLVRLVAAPSAAVVEDDHLVLAAEDRNLPVPGRGVGAQPHDQHQRFATAVHLVIHVDSVYVSPRHRFSPEFVTIQQFLVDSTAIVPRRYVNKRCDSVENRSQLGWMVTSLTSKISVDPGGMVMGSPRKMKSWVVFP